MIREVTADEAPAATPEEWRRQQRELLAEADRLYERHVKPLEQEHWGEFVAVSRDGRFLLGASLAELTEQAVAKLGQGHFAFKVGEVAIGKVR